jgi:hypothetical protein
MFSARVSGPLPATMGVTGAGVGVGRGAGVGNGMATFTKVELFRVICPELIVVPSNLMLLIFMLFDSPGTAVP